MSESNNHIIMSESNNQKPCNHNLNNPDGDVIIFSDFMKQLRLGNPENCSHTIPQMFQYLCESPDKNIYVEQSHKSDSFELSNEFKKENQYYVMTYVVPRFGDVLSCNSFKLQFIENGESINNDKITTTINLEYLISDKTQRNLEYKNANLPIVACKFCKIVAKIRIHELEFKNYNLNNKFYISHHQYFIPTEPKKTLDHKKVYIMDKIYTYGGLVYQDKS